MASFTLNNSKIEINEKDNTPLLWYLRDNLKLTGTKYGCGKGLCGACSVLIDGQSMRSCQLPINTLASKQVVTIEGLSKDGNHAVQHAWREFNVPQCGYCQSGQIISAVALLESNSSPSEQEIEQAMAGNICRCGTYSRIKQAVKLAAKTTNK